MQTIYTYPLQIWSQSNETLTRKKELPIRKNCDCVGANCLPSPASGWNFNHCQADRDYYQPICAPISCVNPCANPCDFYAEWIILEKAYFEINESFTSDLEALFADSDYDLAGLLACYDVSYLVLDDVTPPEFYRLLVLTPINPDLKAYVFGILGTLDFEYVEVSFYTKENYDGSPIFLPLDDKIWSEGCEIATTTVSNCDEIDSLNYQLNFPDFVNPNPKNPILGWQENVSDVNYLIKVRVFTLEGVDVTPDNLSDFAYEWLVGALDDGTTFQMIRINPENLPNCFYLSFEVNTTPYAGSGGNLFIAGDNGTFENGDISDLTLPNGGSISTAAPYSGAAQLRIETGDSPTVDLLYPNAAIAITALKTYILTAYVRIKNALDAGVFIQWQGYTFTGDVSVANLSSLNDSSPLNVWLPVSFLVMGNAAGGNYQPTLGFGGTSSPNNIIDIDNITLIEVNENPPQNPLIVFTEPFYKVNCEKTLKIQGKYSSKGLNCEAHYFGEIENYVGSNQFQYTNPYRFPGVLTFEGFVLEGEELETFSSVSRVKLKRREKWRLKSDRLPPYVVRIITECLSGNTFLINGEEFYFTGEINRNTEYGTMFLLDIIIIKMPICVQKSRC